MRKKVVNFFLLFFQVSCQEKLWKFDLEVSTNEVAKSLIDLDAKFNLDWLRPHSGIFYNLHQNVTFMAKSQDYSKIRREESMKKLNFLSFCLFFKWNFNLKVNFLHTDQS